MIFISREYLPQVTLDEPAEEACFSLLDDALRLHAFDIVCFLYREKLFGLASMGDILRSCTEMRETVRINTRFISAGREDVIRAREIFTENPRIHAIPVTDENGALTGAFTRFDDLLFLRYWDGWDHNRFISRFARIKNRVALVQPVSPSPECKRIFNIWSQKLPEKGFKCREITFDRIPDVYWSNDLILFTDEDQRRSARSILTMEGRSFQNNDHILTFCDMTRAMSEPPAEELFLELQARGVHVVLLSMDRTGSEYQKYLYDRFDERAARFGEGMEYVHPEEAEAFYGELYSEEYARRTGRHSFLIEKQNSFTRLGDCDEPGFKISGGERLTIGQPEKAGSAIFFFGPCLPVGPYVEDSQTFESFLQKLLNDEGYPYRVYNYGCWESQYCELLRIASTPMKKGDVAVIFYRAASLPELDRLDLLQVLEEHRVPAEWMLDSPLHCNGKVHSLYARALFRMLRDRVLKKEDINKTAPEAQKPQSRKLFPGRKAMEFLYLDRFFWNMPDASGKRISNIGIYGNPFTNGHLHLAKTALEHSDRLIVLVLEEESGLFSFAERYAMACAALRGLGDVIVAPSGPFHGTRVTFREYFTRDETTMEENLENEFRIFGELIAPSLGITTRYLGTETGNSMMQRFNRIVTSVLKEYCIETVEIPRKELDGVPISASAVRSTNQHRLRELAGHIPPSTMAILMGDTTGPD